MLFVTGRNFSFIVLDKSLSVTLFNLNNIYALLETEMGDLLKVVMNRWKTQYEMVN